MKTLINNGAPLLVIDSQIKEDWQYPALFNNVFNNVLTHNSPLQNSDYSVTDNSFSLKDYILSVITIVKPIYTAAQIITQLTTSWGYGDTSAHLWATSPTTSATPKNIITFGINTSNPTNFTAFGLPLGPEGNGLVTMTALEVATARLSFHLWGNLIASSLVESGGAGANITLNYSSTTNYDGTYSSSLYYDSTPNKDIVADQIWLSSNWGTNADSGMVIGGYGFNTMMHEIGHSLGFSHPGLYNGSASYASDAVFFQDNRQYTLMSYFGGYNTSTNAWSQDGTYISYKYSQTPMVYDIAAIQSLYGADTITRTGDTVYGYNNNFATNDPEKAIFDFSLNAIPLCAIWDAGGSNDALDCSGWNGNQIIDLTPGNYSSVRGLNNNVGIAFNTIIERAIGGIGNDRLIGNNANNILDGGAGADVMLGDLGNDTYYVDNTADVVTENVNAGLDTVYASIGYTLTANVENLVLSGVTAINGIGNVLNNQLVGNSANNILDGGMGADLMLGGLGNDTYGVDNTADVVTENVNAGLDTVYASIGYTLTANVENLVLTGVAAINGTGNVLNNQLVGNSANNILDGGTGADVMLGGLGNDIYYVDNTSDSVVENLSGGWDIVYSTATTYNLSVNIEALILTGTAVSGFGNTLNNIIYGNTANNNLDGGAGSDLINSGAGDDTLDGGVSDVYTSGVIDTLNGEAGNDTFLSRGFFGAGIYTGGAGIDLLDFSQADSYTAGRRSAERVGVDVNLAAGTAATYYRVADNFTWADANGKITVSTIENVRGTAQADRFIGDSNANVLDGGAGNDVLNGGAGADTLIGGTGNDTYYVDNVGDVVMENALAGTDAVWSALSNYTLANNVESLGLAAGALNGRGNAENNYILGNSANNILDGGTGADTLVGGLGNDSYYVDNTGDVVTENVNAGLDTIYASISYTLTANVENLVLTGVAAINGSGNVLNNQLTGNNADNVLSGGAGADVLYGLGGADRLIGGDGADTLIGGLSRDSYNLIETTAVTDTVVILTGDSLASIGNFDLVNGFKLGSGVVSTAGVDRLDLVSTTIAANVNAVNGVDSGSILSHHINNGIISFDDINNYTAPVAITTANLANVLGYLQANITGSNTVAFVSEGNTFVFQDGGVTDTLVELVGVTASSVNHTGLAMGALWII